MAKLFSIAESIEIIGVDRDRLYHWIKRKRLIKPEIASRGRGRPNMLSVSNLAELALAKNLTDLGIELNFVEDILNTEVWLNLEKDEKGKFSRPGKFSRYIDSVFYLYKSWKEKYDQENYCIVIYKDEHNKYKFIEQGEPDGINFKKLMKETADTIIIADLFQLLHRIEEKIGKSL